MVMSLFIKTFCMLLLIISFSSIPAKTYTVVVEPIYPTYQSKEVYEPLRKWLTEKTGYQIEILVDINYGFYWKNAKGSRMPDFSFDASHVASYRQNVKGYQPLAAVDELVAFHLISLDKPDKGQTVNDFLIGKKVMTLPKPSYASELFNQWFPDLFSSPSKDITALSWQDSIDSIFDGTSDAAIIPDWMLELYPNFHSLLVSKKLPGATFMSSPNVPSDVVNKFKSALLSLKNDKNSYDVLVELNTSGFKEVTSDHFDQLFHMLPVDQKNNYFTQKSLVAQETKIN